MGEEGRRCRGRGRASCCTGDSRWGGRLRQGDRLGFGRTQQQAQQQAQQDEREKETPPHRADHRQVG
jgi:hypothetical protein